MALPYVLKWLAPRGPFIFILEAIVQILALFAFHDKLREPYLSFIDNTEAQFALTKACSFDDTVNSIPSFFLATAAEWGVAPWFERVSSAANVSESTVAGTVGAPYSFGTQQISVNFEKAWPLFSQAVRDNDFANAEVANQIKTLERRNGQGL